MNVQHAYLVNQSSYRAAETQREVGSDPHIGIKVKAVPSKDLIVLRKKDNKQFHVGLAMDFLIKIVHGLAKF